MQRYEYQVVQVQLPKRTASCKDDEKKGGDPKQYACAYPSYRLDKLVSKEFLQSGSPALKALEGVRLCSRVAPMLGLIARLK